MRVNAPLTGVKVVDQTQALAGPYTTMILGDLGAEVVKIEKPGIGDNSRQWAPPYIGDQSCYYLAVNRNKRGIALDIRADRGREFIHKLIAEADVFLTNLRTSEALERHGIDYETLRGINPRLVYLSISGYGRSGPRAGQPGYDLVSQAESGTVALTGEVDGAPMRFPHADRRYDLRLVQRDWHPGGAADARPKRSRAIYRHVFARGADDLAGESRWRILRRRDGSAAAGQSASAGRALRGGASERWPLVYAGRRIG